VYCAKKHMKKCLKSHTILLKKSCRHEILFAGFLADWFITNQSTNEKNSFALFYFSYCYREWM
jgi:hypothetical protein